MAVLDLLPAGAKPLRIPFPGGNGILAILVVGALLFLIGAPMLAVLLQAFLPQVFLGGHATNFTPGALLQVFERPLWQKSLTNSLLLASGSALLGTALACAFALLRHTLRFPGARALDITAWVLLVMPSFIVAQGWVLFASRGGLIRGTFGWEWVADALFTLPGLIAVMALKTFPFAYITVGAALRWNLADLTAAARLSGASAVRTLLTVRLPLLLPAILAGALLVFVETLGDFGLPAALTTTFRFPTLPYSIYAAINQSPVRFDMAGVLALYLFAILFAAMTLVFWLMRRTRSDFLIGSSAAQTAEPTRLWWLCSGTTVAFIAVAAGIPIGTNIVVSVLEQIGRGVDLSAMTLDHYRATLAWDSRLREALSNSLWIAARAAVLAGILGFLAAYLLAFSSARLTRFIDVLVTLTLAVPGVILGVGYIFVWNLPVLHDLGLALYGHPFILVLAGTAGAVPIAVRMVLGSMTQVPPSHLQVAALQGAGLSRRLLCVLTPLTHAALLSAVLAAFGTTVFDLAVTAMLHPPGHDLLPPVISRQFIDGDYGLATASTMAGSAVTVGIIVALHAAFRGLFQCWIGPPAMHTPAHQEQQGGSE